MRWDVGGRAAALALGLLCTTATAWSCSCFSPELRERAARDTLAGARQVAFGRVLAVEADGSASFRVSEGFKGAEAGEVLRLAPPGSQCPERRVAAGENLLLLVHADPPSACGTYAEDHFLLIEFRRLPPIR